MYVEIGQHLLDPEADGGDIEIWRDAEAGAVQAQAADEVDRRSTEDGEPDILDHLALIVLVDRDSPGAVRRIGHRLRREREQGDRAYVAHPLALRPELLDGRAHVPALGAEGHDDDIGVLGEAGLSHRRHAGDHFCGRRRTGQIVFRKVVSDVVALFGRAERG